MFMGGLAANFVAPLYHPAYHFDTIDLILLFFIVVFGSIVAFVWYIASLRKVAPETVGMLGMLEPLSATILSALVLGVSFHAFQVVGIVMTLGAILIMNVVKK
nr:EamA family transporter [Weissella confusa]